MTTILICLIEEIKDSISVQENLIENALRLTAVDIAQQLLNNQALTLVSAYNIFSGNIASLSTTAVSAERTPRWLLGQLSVLLKHHLAYTCRVKKHGTMLYRQGRELDCLSHCLFALKKSKSESDYVEICTSLNNRIQVQAEKCKLSSGLLDIEQQIKSTDPVLWDTICILTQSTRERKKKTAPTSV